MEKLRTGREQKVIELRNLARNSDIISLRGGYRLVMMNRRSRPNTHKELALRSSPPLTEGQDGTGIMYAIIFSALLWVAAMFLFCLEAKAVPLGKELTFAWAPVTHNEDGTPWTDRGGYRLYEKLNDAAWVGRVGIHPNYTSIRYRPLVPGNYKFRVTALTRYARPRLESKPSNEVAVTVDAPPAPKPSPTGTK